MTTLLAFTVLVALVGLERIAELVVSTRNAAWSMEHGGVESGRGHYPFMVVLHTGLLVGALAEAWLRRPDVPSALAWSMLALVVASQALRWWCITTLGRRWNTRVIIVPGLPPVRSGSVASAASSARIRTVGRAALRTVKTSAVIHAACTIGRATPSTTTAT